MPLNFLEPKEPELGHLELTAPVPGDIDYEQRNMDQAVASTVEEASAPLPEKRQAVELTKAQKVMQTPSGKKMVEMGMDEQQITDMLKLREDEVPTPTLDTKVKAPDKQIVRSYDKHKDFANNFVMKGPNAEENKKLAVEEYKKASPEQKLEMEEAIGWATNNQEEILKTMAPQPEEGLGVSPVAEEALAGAVFKMFGKAGDKLLDMWKMRGLPPELQAVIKKGDPAELEAKLRELKLADEMGMQDQLLNKKIDDIGSSNRIEARKYRNENVPGIENKGLEMTKDLINTELPASVTAKKLAEKATGKADVLKKEMGDAYNVALKQADNTPKHNMAVTNQAIIDKLKLEVVPDPVISHVMKSLYTKMRNLTPPQKAAKAAIPKLEKDIAGYEKILLRPSTSKSEVYQLNRKIAAAEKKINTNKGKLPDDSDYYSERELINSIKNIGHKQNVSGGDVGVDDADAQRGLMIAKNMLTKKADELFEVTGSPVMKQYREATKKATDYYGYVDSVDQITQLVKNKKAIPEKVMLDMFNDVPTMKEVIKQVDPALGKDLAEQMMSQLARPKTKPMAMSMDRLNMSATSKQLDSMFNDKQVGEFLKKNLSKEQYQDLDALKNVTGTFGKISDKLDEIPGSWEYITSSEGALTTVGRTLKVMKDYFGYLKNNLVEGAGYMGGLSSRIKPSNEKLKRAEKILTEKLSKGDLKGTIGQRMTVAEETALEDISNDLTKIMSGNMRPAHLTLFPSDSNVRKEVAQQANTLLDEIGGDTQWIRKAMSDDDIPGAIASINGQMKGSVGTRKDKLSQLSDLLTKADEAPVNNVGMAKPTGLMGVGALAIGANTQAEAQDLTPEQSQMQDKMFGIIEELTQATESKKRSPEWIKGKGKELESLMQKANDMQKLTPEQEAFQNQLYKMIDEMVDATENTKRSPKWLEEKSNQIVETAEDRKQKLKTRKNKLNNFENNESVGFLEGLIQ